MLFARVTFTYTGGPQVFNTNFALGVLEAEHISFAVDGEVDAQDNQIFRDITYDRATGNVTVIDPLPNPCEGFIIRETPVDELIVDFEQGDDVTKRNLSRSTKQVLMSVQEVADSREADSQLLQATVQNITSIASTITNEVQLTIDNASITTQNVQASQTLLQNTTEVRDQSVAIRDDTQQIKDDAILETEAIKQETQEIADDVGLALQQAIALTFPTGGIIMWSGAIIDIPGGWLLCDGTNGTPDLRDRFVVGAGATYSVDDTGGSASVTLTEAQLPAHSHTGTTNTTGSHEHGAGNALVVQSGAGAWARAPNGLTPNTDSAGQHSHTLNINNTGGGEAHENRPPYFALAFIMKV